MSALLAEPVLGAMVPVEEEVRDEHVQDHEAQRAQQRAVFVDPERERVGGVERRPRPGTDQEVDRAEGEVAEAPGPAVTGLRGGSNFDDDHEHQQRQRHPDPRGVGRKHARPRGKPLLHQETRLRTGERRSSERRRILASPGPGAGPDLRSAPI